MNIIGRNIKSLNKKELLFIITELLLGSGSAITTSTMSLFNPSIGIVLTISSALLTSIAILIRKEFISKLKTRCIKLRDWIIVITSLFEKTLKEFMIDKKRDEKEVKQLKQIYIHSNDERSEKKKLNSKLKSF